MTVKSNVNYNVLQGFCICILSRQSISKRKAIYAEQSGPSSMINESMFWQCTLRAYENRTLRIERADRRASCSPRTQCTERAEHHQHGPNNRVHRRNLHGVASHNYRYYNILSVWSNYLQSQTLPTAPLIVDNIPTMMNYYLSS